MQQRFFLRKMKHDPEPQAGTGEHLLRYQIGEGIQLNEYLGKRLQFTHTGNKECVACGRKIPKTFQQGYCFPCTQRLARTDICIVKPERCHYRKGTCREPEWGQKHCLIPHTIYLANTTGLKVGITRQHQQMTRWGDQGALAALPLAFVSERYNAGMVEDVLREFVSDVSNWRALITGKITDVDLSAEAESLVNNLPEDFVEDVPDAYTEDRILRFTYPVAEYPKKAVTWNFDKTPVVSGEFSGIRGQYLFIDGKALNVRKFGGYEIEFGVS